MATLISCKKSKAWGKENNGVKMFVISCYFSDSDSKWNVMGQTKQYHFNVTLNADDADDATAQMGEFKKDIAFHESVKCYDFSINELTKGSKNECDAVDIIGTDVKGMASRCVASPFNREKALTLEKARVARLFAKNKWKEHVESED